MLPVLATGDQNDEAAVEWGDQIPICVTDVTAEGRREGRLDRETVIGLVQS